MSNILEGNMLYSIGAAAWKTGISVQTIRRWEKEGKLGIPTRQANGFRVYTEQDIENIKSLIVMR